ncbi:programmed cell death protein 2-like isoform X1 [Clavelina lepadiformis]|uniref:programmed cell death protein 2-like isoform X1 n=2 Tax=Clavelina lepadiformis TaxID=159417 RepID=UPI004042FD9A
MEKEHVLFGVADARIESRKVSWETNKIGGEADLMSSDIEHPVCKKCGKYSQLVVQVYCPVDSSDYHRTMYVFCCSDKLCWTTNEGWTVYRMQCLPQGPKTSAILVSKPNSSCQWNDDDDDEWNDDFKEESVIEDLETTSSKPSDLAIGLESLSLSGNMPYTTRFPQLSKCSTLPCFPSNYINVFECEAAENRAVDDTYVNELIKKYNDEAEEDHTESCRITLHTEAYEKTERKDNCLHKFKKVIDICPGQVIRYSWMGSPVHIKESGNQSIVPICPSCGCKRGFEFQLMPALIPYLKNLDLDSAEVEFGTILIYSCSKNCWKGAAKEEEHIVYCPDPDLKYFKSQKT